MDVFTKAKRSEIMTRIRSKHTAPEIAVRSYLRAVGISYRTYTKSLPGKPDVILKNHKTVILINGCFWHSHSCKRGTTPKSNVHYWVPKLLRNKERDRTNQRALKRLGYTVMVLWECQIKKGNFGRLTRIKNVD
ncbi:very short patch repair endonuclease [soil metagenome]